MRQTLSPKLTKTTWNFSPKIEESRYQAFKSRWRIQSRAAPCLVRPIPILSASNVQTIIFICCFMHSFTFFEVIMDELKNMKSTKY
jgi:hypothetical protein